MTGSTCFWCWQCLSAVDPYRTWAGDNHRCPVCHERVLEISTAALRYFSFLGEGASHDERLHRARRHGTAGRASRRGAYGTEHASHEWRGRASWSFHWRGGSTAEEPRDEAPPRRQGVMTRGEALDVLGLSELASDAEVRAAYRRLAKQHHPDLQASAEGRRHAHTMMARLNAAYRYLMPAR